MSKDLDLDAIEARATAATAGPLTVGRKGEVASRTAFIDLAPPAALLVIREGDEKTYRSVAALAPSMYEDAEFFANARADVLALVAAMRELIAEVGAQFSLDGIRTAALALPVEDRNALRLALAESLPIPRCFDTSPAIMAKVAQTMTAAQREELIGLLAKGRAS